MYWLNVIPDVTASDKCIVNSKDVELGQGAMEKILTENMVLTVSDANVTIDGTGHKFAGTITFSGGSSSAKAGTP